MNLNGSVPVLVLNMLYERFAELINQNYSINPASLFTPLASSFISLLTLAIFAPHILARNLQERDV